MAEAYFIGLIAYMVTETRFGWLDDVSSAEWWLHMALWPLSALMHVYLWLADRK